MVDSEDYSGNHHADGVQRFRGALSRRKNPVEPLCRVRLHSGGGAFHVFAEAVVFATEAQKPLRKIFLCELYDSVADFSP